MTILVVASLATRTVHARVPAIVGRTTSGTSADTPASSGIVHGAQVAPTHSSASSLVTVTVSFDGAVPALRTRSGTGKEGVGSPRTSGSVPSSTSSTTSSAAPTPRPRSVTDDSPTASEASTGPSAVALNVTSTVAAPFADPNFPGILGSTASSGAIAGLSQDLHAVKLALNYHFGGNVWPDAADDAPPPGLVLPDATAGGFEREFGLRYVYAWSRFQKDLGRTPYPLPVNNSRLTWEKQGTGGGELFWRFDTPENIMLKGFVGFGNGDEGQSHLQRQGQADVDVKGATGPEAVHRSAVVAHLAPQNHRAHR